MAIALLQSKSGISGTTSLVLAFPSSVGAQGPSLLVAYVGSTIAGSVGVSDNINGAYHADQLISTIGGIFTFQGASSGTTTVTITNTVNSIFGIIEEWAGVSLSGALDQHTSSVGSSVTALAVGPTGTLIQSVELALTMCQTTAQVSNFAVASPYTAGPESPKGNASGGLASGYLITSSTAAQSATFNWTSTASARAAIATYQTVPTSQIAPLMARKYVLFNT